MKKKVQNQAPLSQDMARPSGKQNDAGATFTDPEHRVNDPHVQASRKVNGVDPEKMTESNQGSTGGGSEEDLEK